MPGKEDPIFKESSPEVRERSSHSHLRLEEDFAPSVPAWKGILRKNRIRIVIASVVFLLIGVTLGAVISGVVVAKRIGNGIRCPTYRDQEKGKVNLSQDDSKNCSDIGYDGKCFKAIIQPTRTIHFNESKRICSKIGWKLANIYSRSHYFMIEGYLRSKHDVAISGSRHISAWLGMNMIPQTGQIVLSDKTNITLPGISWYIGYPTHGEKATHMGIDVIQIPNGKNVKSQGLWNYNPSWNGNGAICEKSL